MRDLNQEILKFNFEKNFKNEDFYVSKSNEHIFNLINKCPNWQKNFINIFGEKFYGKTHLVNIFLKKFKGKKFEAKLINSERIKEIKLYQNIVLENLDENIDEKLLYTFLDIIEKDNKYLIVTSNKSIKNIEFTF